jgi:predicted glycoside hydrolase/deacetylase ChbG (UPF0249 family)
MSGNSRDEAVVRQLIVNADDLGQSDGINRGVAVAVDGGIVTSASLMVRWPGAAAAAQWARSRPSLSLGLHVDLGEWAYRAGRWEPVYEVVPDDDASAVCEELSRQLAMFLRLVGRPPTHLDAHQHVHHREPLRAQLLAVGERLGAPVRGLSPEVRYCGGFYGQCSTGEPLADAITLDGLLSLLDVLGPGVTELSCHPGLAPLGVDSMYLAERAREVATLCDPRLPGALAQRSITTCAFPPPQCEDRRRRATGPIHAAPMHAGSGPPPAGSGC